MHVVAPGAEGHALARGLGDDVDSPRLQVPAQRLDRRSVDARRLDRHACMSGFFQIGRMAGAGAEIVFKVHMEGQHAGIAVQSR